MIERFENLTKGISGIYKSINRIKRHQMTELGLKGTHVMCLHYLSEHPDGMTAAELSKVCQEDKAAISRILSDLEERNLVACGADSGGKKYRTTITLTPEGTAYAEQVHSLILQATLEGGQDISDEEREIFYRTLFRIADNLEQICRTFSQEDQKES